MREVNLIVCHASLTQDSGTLSWSAIKNYHRVEHGWRDIGYHVGIERVGTTFEALLGRPFNQAGAHAPPRNHDSIGICFVGRFDAVPPAPEQLRVGARVIRDLLTLYNLDVEAVVGHRDVTKDRTCPGAQFPLDRLRAMIRDLPP